MMSEILQICTVILSISFTSFVATGSLCLVCGMLMVLFGKDVD